jgi:hypothetical protein
VIAHFQRKDVPMNLVQAAGFPFSNVGLPKSWASFGASSFKVDALFEMHRKNADAAMRATYVLLDGLNRITQRQGALFTATINHYSKAAHDIFAHASFEERASNPVGAVRHVYVSSVDSLREQSDIAAETNVTVGDILGTRVSEALDEFNLLFGKPSAPTTAGSAADAAVALPAPGVDVAVVAEPVARVDVAVVVEPAVGVDAVVVAEPAASVDAIVVAKPAANVDAVVVAEPAAGVGETAVASEAPLVEVVPIVSPAAKTRPKKASPPTKPARRPTSRN